MPSVLTVALLSAAIAALIAIFANWFAKPRWADEHRGVLVAVFVALIVASAVVSINSTPSTSKESASRPPVDPSLDAANPPQPRFPPGVRYEGDLTFHLYQSAHLDEVPPRLDDVRTANGDLHLTKTTSGAPLVSLEGELNYDNGEAVPDREACKKGLQKRGSYGWATDAKPNTRVCITTAEHRIAFLRYDQVGDGYIKIHTLIWEDRLPPS